MFSGGREQVHWERIGKVRNTNLYFPPFQKEKKLKLIFILEFFIRCKI